MNDRISSKGSRTSLCATDAEEGEIAYDKRGSGRRSPGFEAVQASG